MAKNNKKIRICWFSFSCSGDNTIIMTEVMNDYWQDWKKLFDFRYARALKSKNIMDEFDIAFIEGAITSSEQEQKLKEIRSRSKKLVAVGACAVTGMPSGQRNYFAEDQKRAVEYLVARFGELAKVLKVSDVVKVDAEIPGCPVDPKVFIQALDKLVKEFKNNP